MVPVAAPRATHSGEVGRITSYKGVPGLWMAMCLTLCTGCESSQSLGDGGAIPMDDAGVDAADGCSEGARLCDDECVDLQMSCPSFGYASWPMPNEPDAAIRPTSYRVEGATVIDEVTGLIWQREVDEQTRTTPEAIAHCENLELEGRADWRLPGRIELVSLLVPGRSPTIDSDVFPGTPADYFRSSTYVPDDAARSWSVYFGDALVIVGSAETASTFARCVAGEVKASESQFSLTETLAVDRGTELVWRRDVQTASTQSEAEDLCKAMDPPSFRLPTLKELLTIVDETKIEPAIDEETFFMTGQLTFWTSTQANDTPRLVDFSRGTTATGSTAETYAVRCVR